MYQEPTWWFRTEHYWLGYPHWDMKPHIKLYYLLQTSYWLQQMLVLILRLEKPRTDFQELVLHVCMLLLFSRFNLHKLIIAHCYTLVNIMVILD